MSAENVAVLRLVKLTEKALPPVKESSMFAGFDLRSAHDVAIPAEGINK